ncbi:thiamine pyrophosphate-binding protein [Kiloniella laminariae]|uniref:Thiamine pyrophosphate-binding protein n=1 Tax=Kiloniella laminariae TaxID=454162 RepID=A0ABT4LR22_9PROT|nr:thiamine pyrophosphate-binding protein [Kiloniella laminariae]MCZ4282781.1 thiamine pyrophosphate-binding protein [Kiloniella laminariae]
MTAVTLKKRTGGEILAQGLKGHGVDTAFCVPGESYLAVLDALYDLKNDIKVVTCRQEGGAAYMAEAYGKLKGKPGICFVTRGPGATNASIGVHTAFQDSTPMILFIGQVARHQEEREAFQEIDYRRMFGQMAKWVAQIETAERIPEYLSRAFHTATSGRPGPVVLALPEDMLTEFAEVADAPSYKKVASAPLPEDMVQFRSLLSEAERPLLLIGGGGWTAEASAEITRFAEDNHLPVSCAFRRQDSFDNHHELYIGEVGISPNPKLATRVQESDLLIVVGPRLGEMTTSGYSLLDSPNTKQKLVHILPGAEELNRVYRAELAIQSDLTAFARAARKLEPVKNPVWQKDLARARADYLDFMNVQLGIKDFPMHQISRYLRENLPSNAVITNGAGNYTIWGQRFYQFTSYPSQLAPTSGAMGYGVPAGIAAKISEPERTVVTFAGDGCFMMNGQEISTAVQYGAAVIIIVVDNGCFGTIRMHQEREYPDRVISTALRNPDFAALARAYGAHAETVDHVEQFPAAFERSKASGLPSLIHVKVPNLWD